MSEKIKNIPRSLTKDFKLGIIEATGSAFASLLNPKHFDQSKPPTVEHIVNLAFASFHLFGYDRNAKIFPYPKLAVSYKAEYYWRQLSTDVATNLLDNAGMINISKPRTVKELP